MSSPQVIPPSRNAQIAREILGSYFDYEHTPKNFQSIFQKIVAALDEKDELFTPECSKCGKTIRPGGR